MTHSPIFRISPLSSAIGMKIDGEIVAADRMVPAQQRLEADDLAAVDLRLRLIDQTQLVVRDGMPQVVLDAAAFADLRSHAASKKR